MPLGEGPPGRSSPGLAQHPAVGEPGPSTQGGHHPPADSGLGPPSLCRLQQARYPHPTQRPGTGVLGSGPPLPWAQPVDNKHLIHKEADGTSRNRNVAAAEGVWTPRGCLPSPQAIA